ncbi:MAG: hypothetical protein JPMHGGIA_01338 [Saprospiraceae bacterium]|nr:hypothetical protein [Saprospiraceae bacterium]
MKQFFLTLSIFLYGQCSIAQVQQMQLLGHWRDSSIVGSKAYDNAFNEAWGIAVNGHEYAIIGSTSGTHLIDITDPGAPFERMLIPGAFNGEGVIHRDYDDYKCHLYAVCDEGNSTLQIIDFSQLPDTARVVYDSREFMTRVHNIYIDIPKGRLYTCAESGSTGFFALGLYDISNPGKPTFIGHYNRFGDITASHVHDAFVRNDTAYLNCGPDGFAIVDFSDPQNPNAIFTARPNEYPFAGYNHSGWLTPDGKTYVMADENHGLPLKIYDLTNIEEAKVVSVLYPGRDCSIAIPHNPLVSCRYAYVSYYYDGLQVYDISDPAKPVLTHYYPTSALPNQKSYKGSWGNYPYLPSGNIVVADMQNGLFIIKGIEDACNKVYNCTTVDVGAVFRSDQIQLQPNPATDAIHVRYTGPEHLISYRIFSTTGMPCMEGTLQSGITGHISIERLPAGIYHLRAGAASKPIASVSFVKL